jgi:alginate O-acetyltransferase complex protein AlgI
MGLRYIKKMLINAGNPLADFRTMFLLKDYFVFILFAIILCFPIIPWLERKVGKKQWVYTVYEIVLGIIVVLLFIWGLSFVISGQNNPFVYANF